MGSAREPRALSRLFVLRAPGTRVAKGRSAHPEDRMLTRPLSSSAFLPLDPHAASPAPEPAARAPALRPRDGFEPAARVARLRAVEARRPDDPLSLAGLAAAVEDARAAALVPADGPPDPTRYASLRARLEKARAALPEPYRRAVVDPLLRSLDGLGAAGFSELLASDPGREGEARLLLDIAQAVLQAGERYAPRATAAFQEVVADLYEGFLSAEDRRGVKPPDHGVLAPLVRWGSADAGPYTWPASDTAAFGVGAAVVSLPAANASAGLLAWPALAHETAGHDILSADDGLGDELARSVRTRLLGARMGPEIADYWSERIDETAADVLGVLNMGPAAAVGLVGYFRALNGAWSGKPTLRSDGPAEDPHPADIARAYLAAETVRRLSFEGAEEWADRLVAEADRDVGRIHLADLAVTAAVAKASAAAVAEAIVRTPLRALEGRALGDIQDWRDSDEAIVADLRRVIGGDGTNGTSAGAVPDGAYAAHALAAGVYEAAAGSSTPADAMRRTIDLLARMHDRNPAWREPVARAS
jgi:hypothetical protein